MSIQEVFKGKNVFLTGGSGFIGKILIEKLLRSCGGIGNIYVLIRKRKGLTAEERLKVITEIELFDKLKKENPEALKKLIPINGDVKELRLGISDEDRQLLIENVNIIYHGAASVRFDDFLKDAILLNTRGTREVAQLALDVKNLTTFIHLSTTYCNTDKEIIEEKLYPSHGDWRRSIEIAEKFDQHTLNVLSQKYISPLPNTYTFAKLLSENTVYDMCKGKIPAVILRPSVVVAIFNDPLPGWIDNFNGPVGLLTAGGKGLLKVCYGHHESQQDYIPADILVKMILMATKERTLNKELNEVTIYNAAAGDAITLKNRDLVELGSKLTWDAPCYKLFWYPYFKMIQNWYLFYAAYLLYHMIPAMFADGLLKLLGKKTILIKIQRKIYIANMALKYFMHKTWTFRNDRAMSLTFNLTDRDQKDFSFSYMFPIHQQEMYTFYIRAKIGAMKILFKEEFDVEKAFKQTMIMWILDHLLHFTIYSTVLWYLFVKINICSILCNKFNDILLLYWQNL